MGNSFSTPNLVHRLEHGKPQEKEIAAEYIVSKLKRYSDHSNYVQAVGKYSIKHLIELGRSGTPKGKQYAAACLSYLALDSVNKALIIEEGALPVLIELAKTGTIEQKGSAAVTFANLSSRNAENQTKIVKAGAVPLLIDMAKDSKDGHHQVRCWAASALGNIGLQHQQNQEIIGAAGAMPVLLEMCTAKLQAWQTAEKQDSLLGKFHDTVTCRRRKNEKAPGPSMKEMAARGLNMLLYGHKRNQERVVEANGFASLLTLVREGTPTEELEALRTAGNVWGHISPEVANEKLVEAGAIELLVQVARTSQQQAREAAAGLLARLTASSIDYKPKIVEAGGIGAMIALFESGSPQARIWTTKALKNIAEGNDEYREKIMESGGETALTLFDLPGMRITNVSPEVAKAVAEDQEKSNGPDKEKLEDKKDDSSQEPRQRKGAADSDPAD